MTQKPDGGPAFAHGGNDCEDAERGMSLRDYFAGQALDGLLSGRGGPLQMKFIGEEARMCYAYADAMIEARKETNT